MFNFQDTFLSLSLSLFRGERLIHYITSSSFCQPLFWSFFKISFDVMLSLKSGNFYIISYFQAFVKHFFQPFFECPFSRSIDSNHFVVSCSPLLESLFIISWIPPFVNAFLQVLPFAHIFRQIYVVLDFYLTYINVFA